MLTVFHGGIQSDHRGKRPSPRDYGNICSNEGENQRKASQAERRLKQNSTGELKFQGGARSIVSMPLRAVTEGSTRRHVRDACSHFSHAAQTSERKVITAKRVSAEETSPKLNCALARVHARAPSIALCVPRAECFLSGFTRRPTRAQPRKNTCRGALGICFHTYR